MNHGAAARPAITAHRVLTGVPSLLLPRVAVETGCSLRQDKRDYPERAYGRIVSGRCSDCTRQLRTNQSVMIIQATCFRTRLLT